MSSSALANEAHLHSHSHSHLHLQLQSRFVNKTLLSCKLNSVAKLIHRCKHQDLQTKILFKYFKLINANFISFDVSVAEKLKRIR